MQPPLGTGGCGSLPLGGGTVFTAAFRKDFENWDWFFLVLEEAEQQRKLWGAGRRCDGAAGREQHKHQDRLNGWYIPSIFAIKNEIGGLAAWVLEIKWSGECLLFFASRVKIFYQINSFIHREHAKTVKWWTETFQGNKCKAGLRKLQPRCKQFYNVGFAAGFQYGPAPFTETHVNV